MSQTILVLHALTSNWFLASLGFPFYEVGMIMVLVP